MYITFDHIVPYSHGGTADLYNMQLAHKACNEARGAMHMFEWNESRSVGRTVMQQS
jgi:5-methylcytosine-specific restriction endonuclease McrA